MTDTNGKAMLPSLTEYVEKHSSVSEVYDTRRLCALAKYSMETYVAMYERILEHLKNNPADHGMHENLLGTSDRIREVASEILGVLKKGAEIDVLLSTKFDGLQVVALVQQLPVLLIDLVTTLLNEVIDDASNGQFDTSPLSRQIEVQKRVDIFSERMREELNKVVVPVQTATEGSSASASAILAVEEDVINMRLSVPIETQQETG